MSVKNRLRIIGYLVKEFLDELYSPMKQVLKSGAAIWKKVAFLFFVIFIGLCFSPMIFAISVMILFAPDPTEWMDS